MMSATASVNLLERLCAGWDDVAPHPAAAIIVAHPDDEVIGAGAHLRKWPGVRIAHVTDGAPRNGADATASGFSSNDEYAQARQRELQAVMQLVGVAPGQLCRLGFVDQEASLQLVDLTQTVMRFLQARRPEIVLTHPYEGGHPDHDATAFAVHAACRLLHYDGEAPMIVEMASYHLGPNGITPCEFLPCPDRDIVLVELTADERAFKRRLLDCYGTQQTTLRWFPVGAECFRCAPRYDFTQPPHPGTLFYEKFDWGMTGPRWRSLARAALHALGLTRIIHGANKFCRKSQHPLGCSPMLPVTR